ncbi:MAG: hypothetical protein KBS91_02300 [Firmicutes bacterium]|nr:hypothetical protein [Candidatus Caballimonas caccae]
MKYFTVCKQNNQVIDEFNTYEEAVDEIKRYEQEDKNDGVYEEDFYDVCCTYKGE